MISSLLPQAGAQRSGAFAQSELQSCRTSMNLLKNLLLTMVLTVVILATIAGCFILAFMFEGWWILAALIGEVGFFILLAYLFSWWKYPGFYQAASAPTLIGQYLAALLFFTGGIVVVALLAKLHLASVLKVESIS